MKACYRKAISLPHVLTLGLTSYMQALSGHLSKSHSCLGAQPKRDAQFFNFQFTILSTLLMQFRNFISRIKFKTKTRIKNLPLRRFEVRTLVESKGEKIISPSQKRIALLFLLKFLHILLLIIANGAHLYCFLLMYLCLIPALL